jgi:hypothetical protein
LNLGVKEEEEEEEEVERVMSQYIQIVQCV